MLLSIILFALAAIHICWAAGGRWGAEEAIPRHATTGEHLFRPGPISTLAVATALILAGAVPLIPAEFAVRAWLMKGLAATFLLRAVGDFRFAGFFKRHRTSAFAYWDTRLYSPLRLVLAALAW